MKRSRDRRRSRDKHELKTGDCSLLPARGCGEQTETRAGWTRRKTWSADACWVERTGQWRRSSMRDQLTFLWLQKCQWKCQWTG